MSDNHQRFISVIIPVFNNIEALIICLQALENQTYPPNLYEVIVVDNGFDDNLEDLITQFKQARFTSESRPGSYAARNQGIAIAKGEILAFTDSDCIPNQDWLANGIKYLLSVPNCGLVAGKINFFYQNPQSPTAIEIYDSVTFLDQKKYIEKHHYGATANLFTFKKVFEKVGFFNCNLKSGGDKEWGKRVFSHGYSLIYADDSYVNHPARASFKEMYKKIARTREGGYDLEQIYKKNKFAFYGQRLMLLFWRLKPPIKSAFKKINSANYLMNKTQAFKLVLTTFLFHYWGVWLDVKLSLKSKP
jgi:glycosyltransferase involved in cell wall biosynthesis